MSNIHYKRLLIAVLGSVVVAGCWLVVIFMRQPVFDHRFCIGDHDFLPQWSLIGSAIDGVGNRYYFDTRKKCLVIVLGDDVDDAWKLYGLERFESSVADICLEHPKKKYVRVVPLDRTVIFVFRDATQLIVPVPEDAMGDMLSRPLPDMDKDGIWSIIKHLKIDQNQLVSACLSQAYQGKSSFPQSTGEVRSKEAKRALASSVLFPRLFNCPQAACLF